MVELLLVGSLTRDVTVLRRAGAGAPLRWTQPGGAPWHGGLALQADPPAGTADPSPQAAAVAQAGPWGRRFALPALAAFGVRWLGPESAEDTVFRNRSAGGRRQQTLLARARPLRPADLPAERPGGVVVSPLFPEDVGAGVVERLRAAGPFLGLDLQGWLRAVDAEGRVRARRLGGIEAIRAVAAGAQVVKFSAREFQRLGPTDDWREAARAAAGALGAEVLVTRGAAGAFLATPGGAVAEAGGVRGVFDSSGAGDVFLAAYVRARCGGAGPVEALEAAAGLAQRLLRRRADGAAGVPLADLIAALRGLQAVGLAAIRAGVEGESFAADSPLRAALEARLPRPLAGAEGTAAAPLLAGAGGGDAERVLGAADGGLAG